MTIQFWINEPLTLFNKNHILELWAIPNMCYEQKLNAISRLIILLSLVGYFYSGSEKMIYVGILTLMGIAILYFMRKQKLTREKLENFEVQGNSNINAALNNIEPSNNKIYVNPETLENILSEDFEEGTKKNPFSNVLLTQINDEPNRKSAPPAFNSEVSQDIAKNVKRAVQMINNGIKGTNKKLFGDLWEQFQLDNFMRIFYSTPNTRVANDQGAFSKFLYGNMPSSKGSSPEDNMLRYANAFRYNLY